MSRDVLIVDDSATMRQMIKKAMSMADLDVGVLHEATNGIEALAVLADNQVGVMLVDINMPTMNGVQLLTRVKENASLAGIPIVIISTEGSQQRISELEDLGATGYIRKPFQPEKLRAILEPILGVTENATAQDCDFDGDSF